jgi:hypothetical protein
MSAPGAAKAAKSALVAVCTTLWPAPALVTYGPAGTYAADDTVEIRDVTFNEGPGRMATLRRRWHAFALTGRIVTYRGGGVEVQHLATETALDMLAELADYLQDSGVSGSPQNTLGGVVHWTRVTTFSLHEPDDDELAEAGLAEGRFAFVDFTVSGEVVA